MGQGGTQGADAPPTAEAGARDVAPRPGMAEMIRVFGRIGLLSFGGPAAQIALMHREMVDRRPWLTEAAFLRALSLCMMLPGPEAMQLATYAGWRLRGVPGGLLAGLLFVVPGALVIALLAMGYLAFGNVPAVQAAFLGIKAAVIVVVVQALYRLAGKALRGAAARAMALAAFAAIFVVGLPFPLIILSAGLIGAWLMPSTASLPEPAPVPKRRRILWHLLIWPALWAAPLLFLWITERAFLLQLGLFFSKLALVTFGGAYAVLAYMTQSVVQDYGWIATPQMIDALGLAETTPGPLILVTEFVAILAGAAQSGPAGAVAAGVLALWVTFTPCFLWIFLAGPYLDRIAGQPRLAGALQGITAAVVGVIANLSLWFALHVMFAEVAPAAFLALPLPIWQSFDLGAAALTLLAFALMIWRRWDFVATMVLLAIAALCLATL